MTIASKKKVARPRKRVVKEVVQESPQTTILIPKSDEKDWEAVEVDDNWESEGGYAPTSDEVLPPDEIQSRKNQYEKMNKAFKRQVSEQEFLDRTDLTGFGPNSEFTSFEDR